MRANRKNTATYSRIFSIFMAGWFWLLWTAAAQPSRPVIGLSCNWDADKTTVNNTYLQAVEQAGGLPVIIPLSENPEVLREQLARLDGLVLVGGGDFDPLLYGEEPHPQLGNVNKPRDSYDLELIRQALEQNLPLLGICRGMQGINLVCGGNLYQDIPAQYPESHCQHAQTADKKYGTHTVMVAPGTDLHRIFGTDSLVVNSFHHQAVKDLAPGFRVSAMAKDGIIEAFESADGKPVWALQWHPEAMAAGGDEQMAKIFRFFIEKAKATAK